MGADQLTTGLRVTVLVCRCRDSQFETREHLRWSQTAGVDDVCEVALHAHHNYIKVDRASNLGTSRDGKGWPGIGPEGFTESMYSQG